MGIAVLLLCIFLFPMLYGELKGGLPDYAYAVYPALTGIYVTPIPFFVALYEAFRLLNYIDANVAFSEFSVASLRNIKFSAIAMSVMYAMCMPLAVVVAELDDAPGAVPIGFAIACAPLVVATFAAVLQKLVQHAIDLKMENDLTI